MVNKIALSYTLKDASGSDDANPIAEMRATIDKLHC